MAESLISPRIKICGITRVKDAVAAADLGADAIGLVFYANSKRHISDLGLAREIAQAVGPFVAVVGLFVNGDSRQVERVLQRVDLSILQFHGDESEADCRQYARPYIKALRMTPELDTEKAIARYGSASGVLLDTYVAGEPGGTGQLFDWQRFPANAEKPLILAGGLKPDNVSTAIQQTKPYGVDVSGGVEDEPGLKNHEKIRRFIEATKREWNTGE